MTKNYWNILGIPENASQEQIKKAYRKKAFEYHPDRNKSEDAEEKFIEITEAYELLTFKRKLKRITYTQNQWSQKVNEEARRQAKMSYEEFQRKRKEKEYKETLITRIIVIGLLALFILSSFIWPWIPMIVFVIAIIFGFFATLLRSFFSE